MELQNYVDDEIIEISDEKIQSYVHLDWLWNHSPDYVTKLSQLDRTTQTLRRNILNEPFSLLYTR